MYRATPPLTDMKTQQRNAAVYKVLRGNNESQKAAATLACCKKNHGASKISQRGEITRREVKQLR